MHQINHAAVRAMLIANLAAAGVTDWPEAVHILHSVINSLSNTHGVEAVLVLRTTTPLPGAEIPC
ncbi:MAG: hypothetical protein PHN64_03170 [Desulfovibrionaceae bacterium]|nr:hypothetical protein [Desulfovibrionaceae bacterium]